MAELRWNPFLQDYTMIASHRQERPQMPKNWCPFCPGSGRVPEDFQVLKYDNDFPALSQNPPIPDDIATDFFQTAPAYGKCEVILYSKEHHGLVRDLSDQHMRLLVDLWVERFSLLSQDEKIKYIFIFENRGEPVGVTMPHPHGQIYGYSFMPKKMGVELESIAKHREKTGNCLYCDSLQNEIKEEKRMIFQNEAFSVYLPFHTAYPYGVIISANRHVSTLLDLNDKEKDLLGSTLRDTIGTLDSLFDLEFPYMMCMNNAPVNGGKEAENYHFHIEFYPPMRDATKIKFNASSETGMWAACNPTCPENTASELRNAYQKFMGGKS